MSQQPDLTRTDWLAVAIALKDAAQCGCAVPPASGSLRDRTGRVARALFGGSSRTLLADPRMEAVRRFVCTTRQARRPDPTHSAALAAQGFNPRQIDALAALSL